jgi:hypothetical protein
MMNVIELHDNIQHVPIMEKRAVKHVSCKEHVFSRYEIDTGIDSVVKDKCSERRKAVNACL